MNKTFKFTLTALIIILLYIAIMFTIVLYKVMIVNRIDMVVNTVSNIHNTTEYKEIYDDLEELELQISNYLSSKKGKWSVYIKNLESNKSISINNQSLKPASVIKLFNMVTFYDSVNNSSVELTDKNKALVEKMITVSDNNCSNAVVKEIGNGNFKKGAKAVTEFASKLGCVNTLEEHPLYDKTPKLLPGGKNNTSAEDCGLILEKIYRQSCVSEKYDKEMLSLLCNQQRKNKIPAGLPKGTKCANKTGENNQVEADVGIVFSPNCDYIICVIENFDSSKSGVEGIKEISEITYNYFNKTP